MSCKSWSRLLGVAVLVIASGVLPVLAADPLPKSCGLAPGQSFSNPTVVQANNFVVTRPLRELAAEAASREAAQQPTEIREMPAPGPLPKGTGQGSQPESQRYDGALENWESAPAMPSPITQWEGVNNRNGVYPPDTQGDVGPNHYVQWVNLSLQIWDKAGTSLLGPVNGNTLWAALGGVCYTTNDGDPVVLYDRIADRWLLSQFALPNYPSGPFYQAIAISQTGDPTGAYYLYCFTVNATKMNDYPKFGVWPDGYYMTVNQFSPSWAGGGVFAFDRTKMLAGDPTAAFVYFDLGAADNGGWLPSHYEGLVLPPAGAPNYFAQIEDDAWGVPNDRINIYAFHVDWTTPANSTFTSVAQLTTAPFDSNMCGYSRSCIPQPGTSQGLDAISDRLMYRLQYRNFPNESLVVNHTVNTGSNHAGVRWYELRKGATWSIFQQGTYSPDTDHRWMASAAMDHMGDIAVGYSVSSSSVYPSIRYAGRLVGDPAGLLSQGESSVIAGAGSQTGSGARWGDYSTMSVDPVDDCTFWYTQEYIVTTGTANWQTRVASFKFAECTMGATGTLNGTVMDGSATPIVGATVSATSGGPTYTTSTGPGGVYTMILPVGTYSVTATAYGFLPSTVPSVAVADGLTTTQDFVLDPAPSYVVSGVVSDSVTGWPLYATLNITGYPGGTLYTDPVTGFYSVTLVQGAPYTFNVSAWASGYDVASLPVTGPSADTTQDVALNADATTCSAPGYAFDYVYFENFEAGDGSFVASGTASSWAYGVPASGPGSAHSPTHAWATNLSGNYNNSESSYLTSPTIDLSAQAGKAIVLEWWQWLQAENSYDYASVEATSDGSTWVPVYGPVTGSIDLAWAKHSVVLGATYATANFRVRFYFSSDSSVTYPGWYVDDIGVAALSTVAPPLFSENFDGVTAPALPAGWTASNAIGAGLWVTSATSPFSAPNDAFVDDPSSASDKLLDTPSIAITSASCQLTFRNSYLLENGYDGGVLEISIGGGAFTDILAAGGSFVGGGYNGTIAVGFGSPIAGRSAWTGNSGGYVLTTVNLPAAADGQNIVLRFRMGSDSSVSATGWRIDDVTIPDPNPAPTTVPCLAPSAGGLVVGNVYDAPTGTPQAGATVDNGQGQSTLSQATPDPAVDDSFYTLYSAEGSQTFTASKAGYGSGTGTPTVPHFGTVRQDLDLAAGHLVVSPLSLSATLSPGASTTLPLSLHNDGTVAVVWSLAEIDKGVTKPTGPFQRPDLVVKPFKQGLPSAKDLHLTAGPAAPPYAAGDVLSSFPSGLAAAWGVAYDAADATVWVSSPSAGWGGTSTIYEYTPAGALTGRSYPYTWAPANGPADVAFNWLTGNLWVMDVGTTNCIYEINPATGITGATICPAFSTSMRGLAYDPATDTYFAGSWNDSMIHHFDSAGVMLDEVSVGLAISGLAYNADTQHLFVMVNASTSLVYVLDAASSYALLGSFPIAGFSSYGGAGLEIDCDGHLWAVDQVTGTVFEVDSGETTTMCTSDVPWLSESPVSGTLAAGATQLVDVTMDATGLTGPHVYHAQLKIKHDTPYTLANVPVDMTVYAPVVATAAADKTSGTTPVAVNFTGSATGGDGGPYTWDWNFGDGSPHSTAQNPSHTYNVGGTFTVTLTVTDGHANVGTDSHLVMNITQSTVAVVYNLYDDYGRAKACFNRLTGAFTWSYPAAAPTTTLSGTAVVLNGGTKFVNAPGAPVTFNMTVDPYRKKASGYCISGGVYTPLADSNITNNPPGCF